MFQNIYVDKCNETKMTLTLRMRSKEEERRSNKGMIT